MMKYKHHLILGQAMVNLEELFQKFLTNMILIMLLPLQIHSLFKAALILINGYQSIETKEHSLFLQWFHLANNKILVSLLSTCIRTLGCNTR
jgi:hypothetical protein